MRNLLVLLSIPLLFACGSNVREESRYVDEGGVFHDCGVGVGLTRCNRGDGIAETNEVLEEEARELKAEEAENFEKTIERLEAGGYNH